MRIAALATLASLMFACSAGPGAPEESTATTDDELVIISCPWRSCTTSSQCDAGEWCHYGICRINPTITRCESATISRNKAGDREDCSAYGCNPATGKCFTSCSTAAQCNGSNCNDGKCGWWSGDTFYYGATKIPVTAAQPDKETSSSFCASQPSCTTDAQCGDTNKFMCKNGKCLSFVAHCTADRKGAIDLAHRVQDCAPEMCSDIDRVCLVGCQASQHCQVPACNMKDQTCGL